jgi:hypothetical protein
LFGQRSFVAQKFFKFYFIRFEWIAETAQRVTTNTSQLRCLQGAICPLVRADTYKPQAINTHKIGSVVILRRDDILPPDILKRLRAHRRVSQRVRD